MRTLSIECGSRASIYTLESVGNRKEKWRERKSISIRGLRDLNNIILPVDIKLRTNKPSEPKIMQIHV
jgi:hypothetical protein